MMGSITEGSRHSEQQVGLTSSNVGIDLREIKRVGQGLKTWKSGRAKTTSF